MPFVQVTCATGVSRYRTYSPTDTQSATTLRPQADLSYPARNVTGMTSLLTVPEVAARLRIGRSSVYELISAGELAVTDMAIAESGAERV